MSLEFRIYQTEADDACYDVLVVRKETRAFLYSISCHVGFQL